MIADGQLKDDGATYREVLPVSPPGGEDANDAAGNDVGRVMPVVHGAGDGDKGRARDRGE